MKVDSLDQLVEFLNYKGLKVSDLNFSINTTEEPLEVVKESPAVETPPKIKELPKARITSLQGNPQISLIENNEDIIFVKDFEAIPNSCHMGKIRMLDRELYAGICTEGDDSKIALTVSYYEGDSMITTTRQFKMIKIQENQEEQILLNIS